MNPQVISVEQFSHDSANWILAQARLALAERGLFRLALAGGETPAPIYSDLARLGHDLPWDRVQITFGDERCVPPDSDQSNFAMAKRSLLDHAPIPAGNVFRIRGEIDPSEAANEYEAKLAAVAARFGETRYRHDLVLLGLGPDGHIASLFPGSPALDESTRNVIPATGPKPPPQRITMTLPLLNAARQIAFLVNDSKKQSVIDDVLAFRGNFPAGKIRPEAGQITWLIGHRA